MNKIFILGIGGSGSSVVNQYVKAMKNKNDIIPLIMDTDLNSLSTYDVDYKIELTKPEVIYDTVMRVGIDNVKSWFPTDVDLANTNFIKRIEMHKGSHLWKKQSILAFEDYIRSNKNQLFYETIDKAFEEYEEDQINQFYIISSICGGTGSGLLLLLSLYIKQYIKEKFNVDIKFNLLLMCPDIYIDELVGDNKIKCYANSYATLQEIYNVDKVTNGYNNLKNKTFNIDIKLNYFNKILFDSNSEEFQNRSAYPFENVYLIDKIPSLNTISLHEIYSATVLKTIITNYECGYKDVTSDNVYKSIFVKKIIYPYESIFKYVANQKLIDDIKNEWLYFYNIIEKQAQLCNEVSLINHKRNEPFDTSNILEQTKVKSNWDESVLNRYSNLPDYEKVIKYDRHTEKKYVEKIAFEIEDVVKEYCLNFESADLDSLISKNVEIVPLSFFDSKMKKNQKKGIILKEIDDFIYELKRYCYEQLKIINDNETQFLEQNILPLFNKIVIDNDGRYVHPVIVYIRLNILKNYVGRLFNNNRLLIVSNLNSFEEIKLPNEIYFIDEELSDISNSYLKKGRLRFLNLVEEDNNHLKNLVEEYDSIKCDMKVVVKNLKEYLAEYYYELVYKKIVCFLNTYHQFFKKIKKMYEDFEEDIKFIKLIGTNDSAILKNVKALEKYKTYAFDIYCKSSNDNYDDLCGKLVYENLINCLLFNESFKNEDIRNIYSSIVNHMEKSILNNKEMIKLKEKNIIEALLSDDLFEVSEFDINSLRKKLSPLINGTISPINIYIPEGDNMNSPKIIKNIYLSKEIEEYIIANKNKLHIDNDSSVDVINTFFQLAGNNESYIKVDASLSDKEIILTEEINNLSLDWVKKFDEFNIDYSYFKKYSKIIDEEKYLISALWSPHIFSITNNNTLLIYINPKKENEFENSFIKCILWLLMNNLIYTDFVKDSNDYNPVYYIKKDNINTLALIDGNPIKEKNFELLLKYIKTQKNYVYECSKYFDDLMLQENNYILDNSKKAIDAEHIIKQIEKSGIFQLLISKVQFSKGNDNKKFIHLLYDIYERNNNNDSEIIIKFIINILKSFINVYTENDEKESEKVFVETLKKIASVNLNYIKDEKEKIILWFKKICLLEYGVTL